MFHILILILQQVFLMTSFSHMHEDSLAALHINKWLPEECGDGDGKTGNSSFMQKSKCLLEYGIRSQHILYLQHISPFCFFQDCSQ